MANPSRFPFGIALGFYNQFNAYGRGGNSIDSGQYQQLTAGLLAQANTAPDVSQGSLFYTANTANTTITNFTHAQVGRAGALTAAGQVDTTSPLPEGKLITVVFLDNSTQLANNSSLVLAGSDNMVGTNHSITLLASNNRWIEISRGKNNTTEVQTYLVGPASSINVDDTKVALVQNTGSVTKFISALSGGQVGQMITLAMLGSNTVIVQTGGNIKIVGTNAYLLNASGAYQFVKTDSAFWRMITVGTLGNA